MKILLIDFPPLFCKEDNFGTPCLHNAHQLNPLQKRVYSERSEFAPEGIKLLPFRTDLFIEGINRTVC